jgi:rod shape-determining protein MreB
MPTFSRDLGIDLGTINTVICEGNQVLIQEPTMVALLVDEQKIVEWGQAARDMDGRVPESIEVVRPIQNSVIADFEITENFLKVMMRRVSGPMLIFRPRIMITIPYGSSSVETRAVHEAALGAGTRDAYLIHQPLAAALGIDLPISTPTGNMVISLGGGTTQAAVIAMNSIVAAVSSNIAGLKMDDAIATFIRKKYGLIIGQPTAEQLKIKVGAAVTQTEELVMEIQGQDQVTALPRPATIVSSDIVEALEEPLADIVDIVRKVLEKTPPELISDIIDRGVALCGGGSLLRGIDRYLTKALGIPAYLVDNPTTCIAEGAAKALAMREILARNLPPV